MDNTLKPSAPIYSGIKITSFLLIALIPVLALWQISFLQYTMKWDIMDQAFPWRYFISENLRNGIIPLWNPYENLGYPIHAVNGDVWYPIVWIISLTTGYSVFMVNIEYIIHLWIGGFGFYYFLRNEKISDTATMPIAIAYSCSGFFISNAQHLGWIIAIAWLPWVFACYLRFFRFLRIKDALAAAVVYFLMFTGGYPAFALVAAYVLFLFFIYFLFNKIKYLTRQEVLRLIIYSAVSGVIFIALSAGYLVSFFSALPEITRENAGLQQVLTGAFPPKALLTLLFPFSTTKPDFFAADVTLINMYIGVVALLFMIYAMAKKPSLQRLGIFVAGLGALAIAFGPALPLREWLYYTLPFFDKFRFPSLFRSFAIFAFLLLAAKGFQDFIISDKKDRKLFIISGSLLAIVFLATILSFSHTNSLFLPHFWNVKEFLGQLEQISIHHAIVFQGVILVLILSAVIVILNSRLTNTLKVRFLSILIITDLAFAAQINTPLTIASDAKPAEVHKKISSLPEGFPIPDNEPMISKTDFGHYIYPMWYNQNIFHKRTAIDGYNAFELKGYDKLMTAQSRDSILTKPLVYSKGDAEISITYFSPNKLTLTLENTNSPDTIVLVQNYYSGWKAEIDDEYTQPLKINYSLMAFPVSAHTEEVSLIYDPPFIRLLFMISALGFILICGIILYLQLINGEPTLKFYKN